MAAPVIHLTGWRVKGKVVKPIVVGSVSFWQGHRADELHSHRWTVYVRGLQPSEDLSYFIKKVTFQLHPSFPNPTRVVDRPPFEVSERGWGEFEIAIRLSFVDPNEKPIDTLHYLRLYIPDCPPSPKQPVVSEVFDEVVFTDPVEWFAKKLEDGPSRILPPNPLQPYFKKFDDGQDYKILSEARGKIHEEIRGLKDVFDDLEGKAQDLRTEIAHLEGRPSLATLHRSHV